MPIYEYKCKKCGKTLEIIHSISSEIKVCGKNCVADDKQEDGEVTRIISKPAKRTASHDIAMGKVDYDDAAKKGFTTYKRRGKGEYERVAGNKGPATIVDKD